MDDKVSRIDLLNEAFHTRLPIYWQEGREMLFKVTKTGENKSLSAPGQLNSLKARGQGKTFVNHAIIFVSLWEMVLFVCLRLSLPSLHLTLSLGWHAKSLWLRCFHVEQLCYLSNYKSRSACAYSSAEWIKWIVASSVYLAYLLPVSRWGSTRLALHWQHSEPPVVIKNGEVARIGFYTAYVLR